MPIVTVDENELVQVCAKCGARHTIPLKQAYAKAKKGPYEIAPGDRLDLEIDGAPGAPVTFAASHVGGSGHATAEQVAAAVVEALPMVIADSDFDALRLRTAASGPGTKGIRVTSGNARDRLGFDGRTYGPRLLGASRGQGAYQQTAPNTIELPHCPECDAKECLQRTWDLCPKEHGETFFAKHRRAVNALAQHLREQGYSHPDLAAVHAEEKESPQDIDRDYPSSRITLPAYPGQPSR